MDKQVKHDWTRSYVLECLAWVEKLSKAASLILQHPWRGQKNSFLSSGIMSNRMAKFLCSMPPRLCVYVLEKEGRFYTQLQGGEILVAVAYLEDKKGARNHGSYA